MNEMIMKCLPHKDNGEPSWLDLRFEIRPTGIIPRGVKVGAVAADHHSAKPANLQPPPPPFNKHPQPHSHHRHCAHTLSLSFSLDGCEDASSTLQWRQIRPSRPCHRKTSPRKVVTSSPLQLICRHSKSGEKVGCPCNSITTSSTLSQERKA